MNLNPNTLQGMLDEIAVLTHRWHDDGVSHQNIAHLLVGALVQFNHSEAKKRRVGIRATTQELHKLVDTLTEKYIAELPS